MAIIKLVCQGCGANLDALDDRPVIQCGYCGTSNKLEQPTAPPPQPPPPPRLPPPPPPEPPHTIYEPRQVVVPQQRSGTGKGLVIFIALMALVPLLVGGVITWFATSTAREAFDKIGVSITNAVDENYMWVSARPYLVDVDGDGVEDVLGTIQPVGDQQLQLVAVSGTGFTRLWTVELGLRSDLPNAVLHYDADSRQLLFEVGAALYAYDAASGAQRWVASLPDKIASIARDGESLWVATIDDQALLLNPADGKLGEAKAKAKPGDQARALRGDGEYDLIPDLRELDLDHEQFADVRVEQAFCPLEDLPLHAGRRHHDDAKRCANPNGLAWVARSKGTQVPFFIGYERDSKAERWRVQLTKPGSLETIDTGFAQPRAEIFGDEAIISFAPSSEGGNARIRRISLVDGSTLWEATLSKSMTEWINGIVVGQQRVAVAWGQTMRILDLADGRELAALGGW